MLPALHRLLRATWRPPTLGPPFHVSPLPTTQPPPPTPTDTHLAHEVAVHNADRLPTLLVHLLALQRRGKAGQGSRWGRAGQGSRCNRAEQGRQLETKQGEGRANEGAQGWQPAGDQEAVCERDLQAFRQVDVQVGGRIYSYAMCVQANKHANRLAKEAGGLMGSLYMRRQ